VSPEEARAFLARAEYGVLATVGEDGWPYAVPLNHVLSGDNLYLHSAKQGHKLENIAFEPRVSYCAVASAEVLPAELSTLYESTVVFGTATLVEDPQEHRRALELLAERFSAAFPREAEAEMAKDGPRTAILRIRIDHLTGKAHLR
jgi:nitroimidazol reductase NimA-like FMN-containing flavoprotein (pyridoxamine 5'-phosphate oxidase superfamily)